MLSYFCILVLYHYYYSINLAKVNNSEHKYYLLKQLYGYRACLSIFTYLE